MNLYQILVTVESRPRPLNLHVRAVNKEHAVLLAGIVLGEGGHISNESVVTAFEIKLMRRG